MKPTWYKNIAAAIAICGFAGSAAAQYIWLDEKGVKQFSDTPPPASVPKNRILKEAGNTSGGNPEPSSGTAATAASAPMSYVEKNAEFNKRRAEQAEKEKKAAEQARLAEEKAKNCKQASDYQRALESGNRIVRTGKNGEKTFLTDEQRNQEMQQAKRYLNDCK